MAWKKPPSGLLFEATWDKVVDGDGRLLGGPGRRITRALTYDQAWRNIRWDIAGEHARLSGGVLTKKDVRVAGLTVRLYTQNPQLAMFQMVDARTALTFAHSRIPYIAITGPMEAWYGKLDRQLTLLAELTGTTREEMRRRQTKERLPRTPSRERLTKKTEVPRAAVCRQLPLIEPDDPFASVRTT